MKLGLLIVYVMFFINFQRFFSGLWMNKHIQRLLKEKFSEFLSLLLNFTTLFLFHQKAVSTTRNSRSVTWYRISYVNWISSKTLLVYHDHFVIFSLKFDHSIVNTEFSLHLFFKSNKNIANFYSLRIIKRFRNVFKSQNWR
jgi:hypothetical protein